MAYIDYYKILGIAKKATQPQIKKAYRKLARKYHPDLNANDKTAEQKFKEINEANEVLSNPENRTKYDKHGENWKHADEIEKQQKQQSSRSRSSQGSQGDFNQGDYSDFFESMFGGSSRSQGNVKYRGQDYRTELTLNLTDVLKEDKRTLKIGEKSIRMTIPAGVKDGQTIKIKGYGGDGLNGGPKGDLYIDFKIINNTNFKRNGNDLYLNYDLDLFTAVLGGEITIETLTGKVKLKIKPETKNGSKVNLKGKGMPHYKKETQFGNLVVTYTIETPQNVSEKEKELFEEIAKLRAL
ncbi:MAG: curved DNA-binding protein [Crocinitomicaceae bacterium]|jgi:curved DNA-binding protein